MRWTASGLNLNVELNHAYTHTQVHERQKYSDKAHKTLLFKIQASKNTIVHSHI